MKLLLDGALVGGVAGVRGVEIVEVQIVVVVVEHVVKKPVVVVRVGTSLDQNVRKTQCHKC